MALADLLNRPVTIVQRSASGSPDIYGNDSPLEVLVETVGELQQRTRTEDPTEGESSETNWLLILPALTFIRTGDAVIVDGQEYEVVGDPWIARNPRTQQTSHVECSVRRTAASYDENPGS